STSGGSGSGSGANDAQNSGASIEATVAQALKSIDDTVSRMLDDLSKTTLVTGKNTQSQLQELLKAAEKAAAGAKGAAGAGASTGADGASASAPAAGNAQLQVQIG